MKRIKLIATWAAVAVALSTVLVAGVTMASALASAITTSASADPLSGEIAALQRRGLSPAQARNAIEAQSEVARADLVPRVEAALGGAYAGTWFDPEAGQLHIGAPSPASQHVAEGAIIETGVTAAVVTPVRFTWAQLLATQKQWNGKLASLFSRDEVMTSLDPQANAVKVTLGSSVPLAERAALESEAAEADVKILVTVVPSAQLRAVPLINGTCKAFVKNEAFCEKPLASGVSIENQTKQGRCTSGPLAIGKGAAIDKTYALTAGHCIAFQGGVGSNWVAFDTAGTKHVIGPAEAAVLGQGKSDFGDILIERQGYWSEPGNTPVFALTAEWKMTESTKSFPIKGEQTPTVGFQDCHEGQTTGQSCGQITAVQVSHEVEGFLLESMVEHKGANAGGGDSGGPFLFIEPNNEVRMEGITSAGVPGQNTTIYFTPLQVALKALNLELLTTANENRGGPYWHVNGTAFTEGAKQIKMQAKGVSVLKGEVLGLTAIVECKNSYSEGGAIEGNRAGQGQDKGRLVLEQCKVGGTAGCTSVTEPIKTNQLKSYLAYNPNSKQQKFVDVFEPQQGSILAVAHLKGEKVCPAEVAIEGAIAGEVVPVEKESQEGLLNLPALPITEIVHAGQARKVGLKFAGSPAVFTTAYGARLATGEPWGVFGL